ncbi:MAG: hypothetical protein M3Z00_05115 [Actinomycetota bacterium]|nr:hypothetical protein [Actinomycetota bacterium]
MYVGGGGLVDFVAFVELVVLSLSVLLVVVFTLVALLVVVLLVVVPLVLVPSVVGPLVVVPLVVADRVAVDDVASVGGRDEVPDGDPVAGLVRVPASVGVCCRLELTLECEAVAVPACPAAVVHPVRSSALRVNPATTWDPTERPGKRRRMQLPDCDGERTATAYVAAPNGTC